MLRAIHDDELPPVSEKEVRILRAVAALGALAIVIFGFLYRVVLPDAVDPWGFRLIVAGACAGLSALTFLPRWRGFAGMTHAVFVLVTVWILWLVWANDFAAEYGLGVLVVVGVVSLLFRDTRALVLYGIGTLAAAAWVAFDVATPRHDPVIFYAYLVIWIALFVVVVRNQLRAERELATSEARHALAAQGANDGLWDWDLLAGTLYLSPRWKEIIGFLDYEIVATPDEWFERIHPDDRTRVHADLFRRATSSRLFESEHRIAHRDGGWRWVLVRGVRIVDESGALVRMAGSQTDITARKQVEAQLLHDAMHDALTGLPNRSLFLDRLERAITYTHRHPEHHFAVIFLDLDRFKVVNDRIGHVAADQLLAAFARRLERQLRTGDTVARLGGDEFALLLQDAKDPTPVIERLQRELGQPFLVEGQQVLLSASLGIAISSTGFSRPEDVLRDADAAMYRAKTSGRGRAEIADVALHDSSQMQLAFEGQLAEAVDGGQLRLHFQPIVLMETRALVGFEALMRWEHPVHGLRPPAEFIPLAEQTGMILGMGRWALREGCRQMQEWRRAYAGSEPLWLSVNLSTRQFLDPQLVVDVLSILEETGLPPDRLRLEITESVIMEDPTSVREVLQRLRDAGIRVAVDDFGTGYSSLAYLHRLPLDTLKIDRSFVRQMHTDTTLEAVIQTVISLSERLHLDTVAEGVETDEDAQALRLMGCQFGQGFLFSRPLEPVRAEALLAMMDSAVSVSRN